jgi:hypothetical protein
MSEMSPEMMPEMINPMARPKIVAPAASRMARIVARMFSIAFVVSCACKLDICNTCKSSRSGALPSGPTIQDVCLSEDILPAPEFIEIDISGDTQSIFL